MRALLWIDTETGGLEPDYSDLIELCFQETDREGVKGRRLELKVLPERPVDPEAAAVNGYNAEVWEREAVPIKEAVRRANDLFGKDPFIPAGWNVGFDLRFLRAVEGLKLEIFPTKTESRHPFELRSYAWDLLIDMDRPHLHHLCEILGIPVTNYHRAGGDVDMMVKCYQALRWRRRSWGARLAEAA